MSNQWVYGDLCHFKDGLPFIRQYETGCCYEVVPETVGQFTGVLDKNEKEIYEGDSINIQIISWHTKDIIVNEKCPVVFNNGNFGMSGYGLRKEFVRFNTFVEHLTSFEIIGNIHDNPELVELK